MFVGGQFDSIGGAARNSLATLDIATGKATTWDARLAPARRYVAHGDWIWPFVEAVAVHEGTVFVGGWFAEAGGAARNSIAALDARSADATEFDARLNSGHESFRSYVNVLAVHGRTVYVGGTFGAIGDRERPSIGAVDARTWAPTAWNPRASGPDGPRFGEGPRWDPRPEGLISTLAVSGGEVYAGGSFTNMYDWQRRTGAAALDLKTGLVTPWNPVIEGLYVTGLGVIGNSVYLVGLFRGVNGEERLNIAEGTTGGRLPWYPGPLGPIGVTNAGRSHRRRAPVDPQARASRRRDAARGGLPQPRGGARRSWFETAPQALRERFVAELPRLPLAYFEEPTPEAEGWDAIPCGYVQLSDAYDEPAREAAARGWPTAREHLDHLAMMTRPEAVAATLDPMLEGMGLQRRPPGPGRELPAASVATRRPPTS